MTIYGCHCGTKINPDSLVKIILSSGCLNFSLLEGVWEHGLQAEHPRQTQACPSSSSRCSASRFLPHHVPFLRPHCSSPSPSLRAAAPQCLSKQITASPHNTSVNACVTRLEESGSAAFQKSHAGVFVDVSQCERLVRRHAPCAASVRRLMLRLLLRVAAAAGGE